MGEEERQKEKEENLMFCEITYALRQHLLSFPKSAP